MVASCAQPAQRSACRAKSGGRRWGDSCTGCACGGDGCWGDGCSGDGCWGGERAGSALPRRIIHQAAAEQGVPRDQGGAGQIIEEQIEKRAVLGMSCVPASRSTSMTRERKPEPTEPPSNCCNAGTSGDVVIDRSVCAGLTVARSQASLTTSVVPSGLVRTSLARPSTLASARSPSGRVVSILVVRRIGSGRALGGDEDRIVGPGRLGEKFHQATGRSRRPGRAPVETPPRVATTPFTTLISTPTASVTSRRPAAG